MTAEKGRPGSLARDFERARGRRSILKTMVALVSILPLLVQSFPAISVAALSDFSDQQQGPGLVAKPQLNTAPEPVSFIKPDWTGPEPDWSDFGDTSYTIYWQDRDVDDNAQITLFYDHDQDAGNGHLGVIASGIKEDADEGQTRYVWNTGRIPEGKYTWNIKGIPAGVYYIGATIADEAVSVTSYSSGRVRVYHFEQIDEPYGLSGLANVWTNPYKTNPKLIYRHVFFQWDDLEPCGDDNYLWKTNPGTGRYYSDQDHDGTCEQGEGQTANRFKEKFMEQLYQKVDPSCSINCAYKQPLQLIHPDVRVYFQINGPGPDTLRYNSTTKKYEKKDYWLFKDVALLRAPDGDYNVNSRKYPSPQFWAPQYKAHYRDLLVDVAAELKKYPEIYPYLVLVRAQFNAFNAEIGSPATGASNNLCSDLPSKDACVDYVYSHENYDPETRYNVSLAKTYYYDDRNQRLSYYGEANDYHEWIAQTYAEVFKYDPEGKLHAEIALKPHPTDLHFTPDPVYNAFLYQVVAQYGAWFYRTDAVPTGASQYGDLTEFVYERKITRGYTEQVGIYADRDSSYNTIPARYDNPLQWVYWHTLIELHRGIDIIGLKMDVLGKCVPGQDESYCEIFDLMNQYAGQYFAPATADGAWIAFRAIYHPLSLSGNLEMHMKQLDPDSTSNRLFGYETCDGDSDCEYRYNLNPPKPGWLNCDSSSYDCPEDGYYGSVRNGKVVNLGPKNQPYGIWARSIGANGKDEITLDINDTFAASVRGGLRLNVIYLDRGNDTFSLRYKDASGREQTITFHKQNTGIWKGDSDQESIVISDYRFDNSLHGGDLQIVSNGNGEDILHMVKLERLVRAVRPDLSTSRMWANDCSPSHGDTVMYTIAIRNTGTPFTDTVQLSSHVPAGLSYVAGTWNASLGVVDDSSAPDLYWSGVLSDTPEVLLTFDVTVDETETCVVETKTTVETLPVSTLDLSMYTIVNGKPHYLPMIFRDNLN